MASQASKATGGATAARPAGGAATAADPAAGARYVYGIIPSRTSRTFDVVGVDDRHGNVHAVPHGELAAVVSATRVIDYRALSRLEALRYLTAHQAVVERVMRDFTVLPVKFGTVLETEGQVRGLLRQGAAVLAETLASVAGKVQFELVVGWDVGAVFKEIAQEEEVARLKAEAAAAPPAEALARQAKLGRWVKSSLDRRREQLEREVSQALADAVEKIVPNPPMDEGMAANLALLVPWGRRPALDRRLMELDRRFGGRLHFRCVGPLPCYSFATVEVRPVGYDEIERAQRRLGLGEKAGLKDIRSAYRRLAKRRHPDHNAGADAEAQLAELSQAHELLVACRRSRVPTGGPSGAAHSALLITILGQGAGDG